MYHPHRITHVREDWKERQDLTLSLLQEAKRSRMSDAFTVRLKEAISECCSMLARLVDHDEVLQKSK